MKTTILIKTASVAIALLALNTLTFAAEPSDASRADNASLATSNSGSHDGATVNLVVEGPTGARFGLVYTAGKGFRFVDRVASSGTIEVASNGNTLPLPELLEEEQPLTVFIDGPTGFTFVWMP